VKHLLALWMIAGLLALSALVALPAEPVRGMAFDVYVGFKVGMNSAGQGLVLPAHSLRPVHHRGDADRRPDLPPGPPEEILNRT